MSSRGEMGVGTLIIFIALLLVAAVAAGVLIQTAGSLQQKALSTGQQATGQISTNAIVLEVAGEDGLGTLENLTLLMKLAPGSNPIDLDTATVTFSTANTSTSYIYSGSGSFTVNATAGNGTFGVTYVQTGTNNQPGLVVRGDIISLAMASPRQLVVGEQVRFSFMPQSGTPTTVVFFVPDVLSTQRVYLYP